MATVARITAALRIWGPDLDPDKITELLGRLPTKSHCMGDSFGSKNRFVRRAGMWSLEIEESDGAKFNGALLNALRTMDADESTWKTITAKYDVDLFCGVFLSAINEGFELSPDVTSWLGERGVRIGFDIYAPVE